jgi:hypothetical protein
MKKIIAMFLLMPSLALAFSNPEKPSIQQSTYETVCMSAKDLTMLVDEFKEIPYVRGTSVPMIGDPVSLPLVIFVNPEKKTFTIIERAAPDIFCVLAVGANFHPVPKELQDEIRTEQGKGQL